MPAARPSVAIGCMSAVLLTTRLWPMTFFGRVPEWVRSTVKVFQLLSISMALVLKDIGSVESTVVLHSAAINWLLASASRDTATTLENMVNLQGRVNKNTNGGKTA